ncbi:hypothetical protein [Streptomyces sp. NPDC048637]|uniref:hypothetical protein n=1 Tax=Streptomyces sp. NPDC048637 TaxID=3155636 RepID=UPI0034479215
MRNGEGEEDRITRLLPWSGPEGKPGYLITDRAGGYLTRVADRVESVQLEMGHDLLGHAIELIDDAKVCAPELRYLAARLAEALRDALRIAESRGDRLPTPGSDGDIAKDQPAGTGDEGTDSS